MTTGKGPQPPLQLWSAFERHLREQIKSISHPDEIALLPALSTTDKERDNNILLYMESWINHWRALVPTVPHEVHFADTLLSSEAYTRSRSRIDRIAELLRAGSNEINDPQRRFLSRRVEYAFSDPHTQDIGVNIDRQLREHGIRHFHLGETKRTDELLFAILRDGHAYLFGVFIHDDLYSDAPLLIAQSNWPTLFEIIPGISGDVLSPQQVRVLRRRSGNFVRSVGGRVLMPREMFTAAGFSAAAVSEKDWMYSQLLMQERRLMQPGSPTRVSLAQSLGVDEGSMILEFVDHDENFGSSFTLQERSTSKRVAIVFRDPGRLHLPEHG